MGSGFSAIGLMRPKILTNIGGALRAAHVYGASLVAIQGDRTPVKSCQDVTKAWRSLPVLRADDIFSIIPYDAVPIAVDLLGDAKSLVDFAHPERAFYIFGPEDGTISKAAADRCRFKVMVPGRNCMNLAATVNVVLYDRMAKSTKRPIMGRIA